MNVWNECLKGAKALFDRINYSKIFSFLGVASLNIFANDMRASPYNDCTLRREGVK